uniref:DDB1 and CUL4 associated factor 17 n=1 Tax=Anser brachyrhynchus TaxID=132585 RepID=A0A8B9D0J3_9AVES
MRPAGGRRAAPRAPNACRLLGRRAHGFYARDAGVALRTNMGLLRSLICQESTTFKNVWTTHSASPIAYERGRIYLDNYQCCISRSVHCSDVLLSYSMNCCRGTAQKPLGTGQDRGCEVLLTPVLVLAPSTCEGSSRDWENCVAKLWSEQY